MKTITIELNYTLADLEEKEGLDFGYNCADPSAWLVVAWDRINDGDEAFAVCTTGKTTNLLRTYYGETNLTND